MVKVKGPFKGKTSNTVTVGTPEGQIGGRGGKLGHRTKQDDQDSTTWDSDRVWEYQKGKKIYIYIYSHKDQSFSRPLRGSYRSHKASGMFPAWRKQVNKLIKEIMTYTNSNWTRQNLLRASDRHTVYEKLNKDKRHLTRERRQGTEQLSKRDWMYKRSSTNSLPIALGCFLIILKDNLSRVPWWHNWLRIQYCRNCGTS